MIKADLLLDTRAILGEGPAWESQSQRLYWVDITGKAVHVTNPATGSDRVIPMPCQVGTIAPRASGGAVVATQRGLAFLDLSTGALDWLCHPEADKPENRFNDGKCDPAGRFFAGTLHKDEKEPLGALYRLDADRSLTKLFDQVIVSNGLGWSPDRQTFYYIDSMRRRVDAFAYDLATGTLSQRRTIIELPAPLGFPDGMTVDDEGCLWIAEWGGFRVGRWDPRTGKLVAEIPIPVSQVTSCCFGGPRHDQLYITTAAYDISPADRQRYPHSGSLFIADPGITGAPSWAYQG
jgi:sugar lactone lactonase YvrE